MMRKYRDSMGVAREVAKITAITYFVICLSYLASGHTLDHYARDAYTFEPIEDVYVVVMNNETGVNQTGFSDSTGHSQFTIVSGNYTTYAYKPAYNERINSFEMIDDLTRISYLTYESDSAAKFTFSDMTFRIHEWCYYYEDNDRLFGCYYSNDTIFFPINRNYTAYPKLNIYEQIGIPRFTTSFITQILIFIIVGMTLIGFGIVMIAIFMYFARKFL